MRHVIRICITLLFVSPIALLGAHPNQTPDQQATEPASTQRDLQQAWCVNGRVTDAAGRPLSGVRVVAHTGVGTLHGGGMTTTNEKGEYTLRFGPGMYMMNPDDSVGVQAANIVPNKPGYFEKDMHRHGDLLMALKPPAPEDLRGWRSDMMDLSAAEKRVLLPDQSRRLDFVMIPAVQVYGRMTTPEGVPFGHANVSMSGDALPPCSSAVAAGATNDKGGFLLNDIPTGTWWFDVNRHPQPSPHSGALKFERPGDYEVALVFDWISDPPTLTARIVSEPKETKNGISKPSESKREQP